MSIYVIGISGASGAPYARRVLQGLVDGGHDVKCVITDAGRRVLDVEESLALTGVPQADQPIVRQWTRATGNGTLELVDERDVAAPVASGTYPHSGMAVVPCSMGTMARIATGASSNLIERAADVCLKERRKLVLVPRETPLGLIHLRNMTSLTEAGAVVMPAMPGFYHRPQSVQDMVDFIAGRILSHLGVEAPFAKRWAGPMAIAGQD